MWSLLLSLVRLLPDRDGDERGELSLEEEEDELEVDLFLDLLFFFFFFEPDGSRSERELLRGSVGPNCDLE